MGKLTGVIGSLDERTAGLDSVPDFNDSRFQVRLGEVSYGVLTSYQDTDFYQLRLPGPGDYVLRISVDPANAPPGDAPWSAGLAGVQMRVAQPTNAPKSFYGPDDFWAAWDQADGYFVFHYPDTATTNEFAVSVGWLDGYDVHYAVSLSLATNPRLGYIYPGGAEADFILGTNDDDQIYGWTGDDSFLALRGNDAIDGGPGSDTVIYAGASSAVRVELARTPFMNFVQFQRYGFAVGGDDTDSLLNVENIVGTSFNDFIKGNDQDNHFEGGDGADRLDGDEGNDRLAGRGGDDILMGGWGIDHALFDGPRSRFAVSPYSVKDLAGTDGNDNLQSIERLDFADRSVALDTGRYQSAGQTALVLHGLFGDAGMKNLVYAGLGLRLFDQGLTIDQVVAAALQTDPFLALAGTRSNTDFVKLVYKNVVGVAPATAELSYYVNLLNAGTFTQASLGVAACQHDLNAASPAMMGIATSGLEFIPAEG